MAGETYNVLNRDFVVEFTLVFRVLEAEAGVHDIVWIELAEGCIAEKVGYIAVLELTTNLLQDDGTLVEGALILLGYCKGLLLSHNAK